MFGDTVCMEAEALFVETVEDLRKRCDLRASEYDMVQASGLIRRLLMDGPPLWHAVNKTYKTKPLFRWVPMRAAVRGDLSQNVMAAGLAFDPVIAEAMATLTGEQEEHELVEFARQSGNHDKFLATKVVDRLGTRDVQQSATVRDLIKHYANREGGVHHDPGGKSTNEFIEQIRHFADEDLRRTLLACGRIVVRTLEPMAAALMLKDTPWPMGLDFRYPPADKHTEP